MANTTWPTEHADGWRTHAVAAGLPPDVGHMSVWPPVRLRDGGAPMQERLRRAGFAQARCCRSESRIEPQDPVGFSSTVCLRAQLDRLPPALRNGYVAEVLRAAGALVLDYVRLNIVARA
jgi:hypothetical protein